MIPIPRIIAARAPITIPAIAPPEIVLLTDEELDVAVAEVGAVDVADERKLVDEE
jgi:hypothetical protein